MTKLNDYFNTIKGWGLTALFALTIGVFLFIFMGWYFLSGICFGVFFTRNWDIIVKYIKERTNINI